MPPLAGAVRVALMTWDEVCADPLLQDLPYKIELNKWGNIEMSPARNRHGEFQGKINYLLQSLKPEGLTITECAIQTTENVKVPDVAWISFTRYDAATDPDVVYTDTAPEICVEIISPSNVLEEQMHKGRLYLQAGGEEFWLCNELGDVRFFDADGPLERSRVCPEFPARIHWRR